VSKRSIVVAVVIAALALTLGVVVPPLFDSPSHIAGKAAGTWQETGHMPAYTMQVRHTSGREYSVTYPRWQYVEEPFQLQGEQLVYAGGENTMNDAVTKISYDNGSDQLTISDNSGEHVYTLSRVARPSGIVGIMREVGGPIPGPRPHPNVLIEARWATGEGPVVASATSSQNGRFSVSVAPGRYVVVPVAKGDEMIVPDSVVVTSGAYAPAWPFFSVR
jgi:hypothetical protein